MSFWRWLYGRLYLIFPNVINFLYRTWYQLKFEQVKEGVYFDKPPDSFKKMEIGKNSSSSNIIHTITFSPSHTGIEVGSYTRIGENLYLMPDSKHTPNFVSSHMNKLSFKNYDRQYERLYLSKRSVKPAYVFIGSDVWIGNDVKVIGSRKISDGAIIAAGAVVTKDVGPYEIVGGVPAKHIGYRFSKKTISGLLKIKWWHWPEEKIKDNIEYFYDVNAFLKKHK